MRGTFRTLGVFLFQTLAVKNTALIHEVSCWPPEGVARAEAQPYWKQGAVMTAAAIVDAQSDPPVDPPMDPPEAPIEEPREPIPEAPPEPPVEVPNDQPPTEVPTDRPQEFPPDPDQRT